MSQQRLFAVLGLFVGGFDVEAAEAVCVDSEQNVVDGLATLVDHGLIHRASVRDRARLSMLEPIREFAIRRLRDHIDRYDEIVLRQAVLLREGRRVRGRGVEGRRCAGLHGTFGR